MEYANRSGQLIATNDVYIDQLLADDLYDVRSDGTVWTLRTKQGHIGTSWRKAALIEREGYTQFTYGTRSNRHHLSLHRLIYRKFVGELQPDLVINHKDGNKTNNASDNLELVSQSKNNEHRFQDLNHPAIKGNRKATDEEVLEIRALQASGWTNKKLREKFGLAKSTISYIVNKRTFGDVESATTLPDISIVEPNTSDIAAQPVSVSNQNPMTIASE